MHAAGVPALHTIPPVAFDDPALGIDWGLPLAGLTLSDKDRKHPRLAEMLRYFD